MMTQVPAIAVLCLIAPLAAQAQSRPTTAGEVAKIRFHSDPLVNLHHVLYAAAWARRAPDAGRSLAQALPAPLEAPMTADERTAWDAAIAYYDKEVASRDLLFGAGMVALKMALVRGDLASGDVGSGLRAALESAMPIYRRHFWPQHDAANRAWTAAALERMQSIAPATIAKLEKLYGAKWFSSPVRADVVWVGNRQGAYASLNPTHATVSIKETGWTSVEMVFHEFSHVLVLPLQKRLTAALGDRVRTHGILWHVIQFYVTGAVVQDVLKGTGMSYTPYLYSTGLFDRAWGQYREPVETNWAPYVAGTITLDEAIAATVKALK
jgi:hypothetical protein